MKAVCWHGTHDVRVDTVPEPKILNPRDAIIKVTSTKFYGHSPAGLFGYSHLMGGYAGGQAEVDLFNQLKQTEGDQIREIRKHLTKTMANS